eukprot:gb/GECH01008548.1/.p1 GENE.gb/GECH01008548.1/~~gb/GECH01008548.1/.p1  ORF type:complete len:175 (+),score=10.30 gb/GECH01008548.1/:1-525(+)
MERTWPESLLVSINSQEWFVAIENTNFYSIQFQLNGPFESPGNFSMDSTLLDNCTLTLNSARDCYFRQTVFHNPHADIYFNSARDLYFEETYLTVLRTEFSGPRHIYMNQTRFEAWNRVEFNGPEDIYFLKERISLLLELSSMDRVMFSFKARISTLMIYISVDHEMLFFRIWR